jgi:hypothetical protein
MHIPSMNFAYGLSSIILYQSTTLVAFLIEFLNFLSERKIPFSNIFSRTLLTQTKKANQVVQNLMENEKPLSSKFELK